MAFGWALVPVTRLSSEGSASKDLPSIAAWAKLITLWAIGPLLAFIRFNMNLKHVVAVDADETSPGQTVRIGGRHRSKELVRSVDRVT